MPKTKKSFPFVKILLIAALLFVGWKIVTSFMGKSLEETTADKPLTLREYCTKRNSLGLGTYESQALGIQIVYCDPTRAVFEKANTIYVSNSSVASEADQYVEVFKKEKTESISDAIKRLILKGYSLEVCQVEEGTQRYSGQYTIYDLKKKYVEDPSNCPMKYTPYGGDHHFEEDATNPERFFFYSLGQYDGMWEVEAL